MLESSRSQVFHRKDVLKNCNIFKKNISVKEFLFLKVDNLKL